MKAHKITDSTVKQLLIILACIAVTEKVAAQIFSGQKGSVKLSGDAPQEMITAESTALIGKLDLSNKKFNFRHPLNTFSFSQGDLQKKHAEETFFESHKYPNATFAGEIINDTDLSKDGSYPVTVKGKFTLHGVEKELKIPAVINVQNGTALVTCKFNVFLADYNIKIPRLVSAKVAPEFTVDVQMKLTKT